MSARGTRGTPEIDLRAAHRAGSKAAGALLAEPETADWVRKLAAADVPDAEVRLPAGSALAEVLLDLAVPQEEINPVVAGRAALAGDELLTALLDRCVRLLVRDMGVVGGGRDGGPRLGPSIPELPDGTGPAGTWFALYVLAAAAPHTRAYHAGLGVPPDVSRRTLADVGRQFAVHRRRHGVPGLANSSWLLRHFRGVLFQLGRLQYERTRLGGTTGEAVAAAGLPYGPGDPALAVHIPDFHGPLTPDACDDSLARARAFFARHFPAEPPAVATCHSWLLDRQLADRLPADSNIVRFQSRFHPGRPGPDPDDRLPLSFVFGDATLPLTAYPRRTTLQRTLLDHLTSGGHWYEGNGWFRWAD
ncbi:hypothetical protein SAMN05216251_109150 [Actinacidiphila alni]|uniref:Acyltransferase n=1 Tax=Actinacidiphila alni TaxID=380248 RepID=A0A1I2GK13_9ACTN|nr:acyltransferase domain-containing protein [Actinacidiphila alni]SFF18244.1 hypothetical protein SAMN05216251_109150 [Actinacidiphila alni]